MAQKLGDIQRLHSLAEMPGGLLQQTRVVAADVDDTVTTGGRIPPGTLVGFSRLAAKNVAVGLVTGRSAGWAQALATYLPGLSFVVGENGLVMFDAAGNRRDLGDAARQAVPVEVLRASADRLGRELGLRITTDDAFRLFERTLDRPPGFDQAALARCRALVDPGCEVIASSIQIHVRPRGWGKADGLRAALQVVMPGEAVADDQIVFIGDSANDRPLFAAFPLTSVGVRNVTLFLDELGPDRPRYITEGEGADGFAELVDRIVAAQA